MKMRNGRARSRAFAIVATSHTFIVARSTRGGSTSSHGLRAKYATAAEARHRGIVARIEGAGPTYLHLSTDRDWLSDTVQFASRQDRARRARPSDATIARFRPAVAR